MTEASMVDFALARKRRHFVQCAHGVQHFAPWCGGGRVRRGRTKRHRAGRDHAIRARGTVGIRRRRRGISRCGRRPVVPVAPVIGGSRRRAWRRSIHPPVVPVWIILIQVARRRIGGRRGVVRTIVGIIAGRVISRWPPRVVPISISIRVRVSVSGPTPIIRPAPAEAPTPASPAPTPAASAPAAAAVEAVTVKAVAERSTAKS